MGCTQDCTWDVDGMYAGLYVGCMWDGPWDVRGMYVVYAGWSMGHTQVYVGCTRFNFHPADIPAYTTYSPRDLCFLPMLIF